MSLSSVIVDLPVDSIVSVEVTTLLLYRALDALL